MLDSQVMQQAKLVQEHIDGQALEIVPDTIAQF
jgi:hypothetical protein